MKKNSQVMKRRWNWRFKIVSILLYTFSIYSFGQVSEKTFTQEIDVNENINIVTNVPTSLDIQINTHVAHRSNTKYGYIVIGKNNQERLFVHKEYDIQTWERNTIRQEVDIKIKSKSQANNEAFFNQLKIILAENQNKKVVVDANMNLAKFTLQNGRFKSDASQIILKNGNTFSVEYLEIKTRLFIPKSANLKVNSILNHTLILGDLDGDLDLNIQYGEVYGKKIKNLNANLRFCYNVIFKEAEMVNANATNSHLKIDKVKNLTIGENKLSKDLTAKNTLDQWMDNNSSMNIYNIRTVKKMVISDTANDKINIGEVDYLEIKSSIFSNYDILKLNETLILNAKNGDISISEVSKDFKNINLKNTHSKVTINIPAIGNYGINIFNVKSVEYKLLTEAKLMKKESNKNAHFKIGKNKNTGVIDIQCDRCELDIWD
ncbi:MAG: hypothetical protein AB8F94_00480 [Saprospiraceae bacterium]